MQPSIPSGTTLQNRYKLIQTIGHGGFGRTYLAEDQARFNELCVLKEYSPSNMGTYALEKSKELFQREAQVLYQIQHPQIPQFRASFAQGKRLFLVQDYVKGKTYSTLLKERLEQGKKFSEAEMVQFLQQMLPVLAHIHSKGIIHRDISPDNIILRESDRLPVLIDFGVVKEGISQAQSTENTPQGTTVGKIGYSPNEQLQTGQVYPNSDLYALAVTVVVLMTGKKPQELLDQSTMTWCWYQWLPTISSWFSNLLTRMLSLRPNNRYQSATEVAQSLRSLTGLVESPVTDSEEVTVLASPNANTLINESTLIVPGTINRVTSLKSKVTTKPHKNPDRNSHGALLLISTGIILLLVVAPIMLIGSIFPTKPRALNSPKLKVSTPEITPTPSDLSTTPAAVITPTPTPELVTQTELLSMRMGETISKQGNLKVNQTMIYIVPAKQGDNLNISLSPGGVTITVLAPNREPINFQAKQVLQWQGIIPLDGDYYIQLNTKPEVAESDYKLDITLTHPVIPNTIITPSSQPTPGTITPTPQATPSIIITPSSQPTSPTVGTP